MVNYEDVESPCETETVITWYAYECPYTGREYFFEPVSGVTSWVNPIIPSIYSDFAQKTTRTPSEDQFGKFSKKSEISAELQKEKRTLLIFSSADGEFQLPAMTRQNNVCTVFVVIVSVICFNSICLAIFVALFETPSNLIDKEISDKELLSDQRRTSGNISYVDGYASNNAMHDFEGNALQPHDDEFKVINIFTGEDGKHCHKSDPIEELLSKTNNFRDKVDTNLENQGPQSTKSDEFVSFGKNFLRQDSSITECDNNSIEDDDGKALMGTEHDSNYGRLNKKDICFCDSIQSRCYEGSLVADKAGCSFEHNHDSVESHGTDFLRTENDEILDGSYWNDATISVIDESIGDSSQIYADAPIADRKGHAEPGYNFASPSETVDKGSKHVGRQRTSSSETVGSDDNHKTPHSCWIPFAYLFNQHCRANPSDGSSAKLFDAEALTHFMME